jgi:hypothetical protein
MWLAGYDRPSEAAYDFNNISRSRSRSADSSADSWAAVAAGTGDPAPARGSNHALGASPADRRCSAAKERECSDGHLHHYPSRACRRSSQTGARLLLTAGTGGSGHHCLLDVALHRTDDVAALTAEAQRILANKQPRTQPFDQGTAAPNGSHRVTASSVWL